MKLIKYYADWCWPCKQLTPVINGLKTKYKNVEFIEINVEKDPDNAIKNDVQAVPTVLIFDWDKEIARILGMNNPDVYEDILKNN